MARQRLTLPPIFNQRGRIPLRSHPRQPLLSFFTRIYLQTARQTFSRRLPPTNVQKIRSHPRQPLLSFSTQVYLQTMRQTFSRRLPQPTFRKIRSAFPPRSYPRQPLLSFSTQVYLQTMRQTFSHRLPPTNVQKIRDAYHCDHTRVNRSFLSPRRFICKRRDRLSPAVCSN